MNKGKDESSVLVSSLNTVDSRYLEVEGTCWNTSRYPYFDISDVQNWGKYQTNNQISQWLCNVTPLVRNIYWKYCGKGEKLLLFSTIFSDLILDFSVKTRNKFSLRDKRWFEITEVEITRVDCICPCLISWSLRKSFNDSKHLNKFDNV